MRAAGPARTLFTSPRWDCRFWALLRRTWLGSAFQCLAEVGDQLVAVWCAARNSAIRWLLAQTCRIRTGSVLIPR
jgi:hypothetical protein